MKKIPLLRDRSICHQAWLGKLGVNMNSRQFLGVICGKNLRESGILSLPWGPINTFHRSNLTFNVEVISRFWNVTFWRQYRNWLIYTWDKLEVVSRVSFNGGRAYTLSYQRVICGCSPAHSQWSITTGADLFETIWIMNSVNRDSAWSMCDRDKKYFELLDLFV